MSIVSVDTSDVIVETVKLAERDTHGQTKLVVRLYESAGGRVTAALQFGLPLVVASVTETNLLEQPLQPADGATAQSISVEPSNLVRLVFEPLQIKTIVVEFRSTAISGSATAARL